MGTTRIPAPRDPTLERLVPGLIVAVTFLVFADSLGFDFVYDDRLQILHNPSILSWHYFAQYFTSDVWSFRAGSSSNYYRPLFLVWLRLNHALFGLQPPGWHLTSVLMHLLVTLEVYWLGVNLIGDRLVAAVAAALFGLHPIHTESVVWVSGVTDPLVAALMLASLLAYLHFKGGGPGQKLWFIASLVLYSLATFTKEVALIFPIIIFAYQWMWWPVSRSPHPRQGPFERLRVSMFSALPFAAASVAYIGLRMRVLGTMSSVITDVPVRMTFFTWPSLLWFYVQKLVWPSELSPFYDSPYVKAPGVRNFLLPGMMVALTVGLLWFWAWRLAKSGASPERLSQRRALVFAAVWLGLPFLTVLNLSAFPTGDFAKDRYLYVPSIGAAWLAAMGWRQLKDAKASLAARRVHGFAALAACLVLGTLSLWQSTYWSNDLVLYARACAIAPHNTFALGNMGLVAYQQGYPLTAMSFFKRAVDADPSNERIYYNMAVTELDLNRPADADRDLSVALRLAPDDATAFFALGKVRYREGRLAEAASLIRRALELNRDAPGYHFTLGTVLEQAGDMQGALHEFTMELAAYPSSQDAKLAILHVKKRIPAIR